jgi:hypothetical protein
MGGMRPRQRVMLLLTVMFVLVAINAYRWWPSGGRDGTTWASGYTDEGFQAVRVGMTRGQVYALIGKPLAIRTKDDPEGRGLYDVECWSGISDEWDYRRREICFDDDVVSAKHGEIRPGSRRQQ